MSEYSNINNAFKNIKTQLDLDNLIIEYKSVPNLKDYLLLLSIKNFKIFEYLVEHHKANLNNNKTILHLAAQHGNKSIINYLINYGLDVNATDDNDETPIIYATRSLNVERVKYLIEQHKAEIHVKTKDGYTLLHLSALLSNQNLVNYFIELGLDVNAKSDFGATPAHIALINKKTDIVIFLIEQHKADIHVKTNEGDTLLTLAATAGLNEIIEYLIRSGLDVNETDIHGELIIDCIKDEFQQTIIILLANGSKISNLKKQKQPKDILKAIENSEIADKIYLKKRYDVLASIEENSIPFILHRLKALFFKSGIPIGFKNYLNSSNIVEKLKIELLNIHKKAEENKNELVNSIEECIITLANRMYPVIVEENLIELPSYTTLFNNRTRFNDISLLLEIYNKKPYINFQTKNIALYILSPSNRNEILRLFANDEEKTEQIFSKFRSYIFDQITTSYWKDLYKAYHEAIPYLRESKIQTLKISELEQKVQIQNTQINEITNHMEAQKVQNDQNFQQFNRLNTKIESLFNILNKTASEKTSSSYSDKINDQNKRKRDNDDNEQRKFNKFV